MSVNELVDLLSTQVGEYLPALLSALAILFVGWLVALAAAAGVRGVLRRTNLDNRLAAAMSPDADSARVVDIENWASRGVYYLIMLFVIVAFFQQLDMAGVTGPIENLLDTVLSYVPQLIGAGAVLLAAWIIASIVRFLVQRVGSLYRIDERLVREAALEDQPVSVSGSLATAAYWLVFLFFLPALLDVLGVSGLAQPVQNMLDQVLAVVPDLFGSGIILLVGWFIARIVRQIVTNLLAAAGADQVGQRVGFDMGDGLSLSGAVGTIVYVLILISVVIQALETLNIAAISDPATAMLATVLDAIPNLFAAALLLAVAYLIGRLVSGLATSVLTGVGFNQIPAHLGLGGAPAEGQRTPAELAGYVTLAAIMLFAAIEAAGLLGFENLSFLLSQFVGFGANVILALVVFGIGLYLANLASSAIMSAAGERARTWAWVARAAIVVLVAAMALQQMGIGEAIVSDAFRILFGTLGIAAGLAFGLGSREIAGREAERWLASIRGQQAPPHGDA